MKPVSVIDAGTRGSFGTFANAGDVFPSGPVFARSQVLVSVPSEYVRRRRTNEVFADRVQLVIDRVGRRALPLRTAP